MSNPWVIDESDFFEIETHEERMRFLLRYAILAPSGHNTQPWSFHITADGVQVFADTSRRLMVVDHNDHELLMSVGAAIANFRVAAAHFGFDATVGYETRSIETLPVATIVVRETCGPDLQLASLFAAIRQRHTNREPYDEQPLDPMALRAVCDLVDANGGMLRLILPRDKDLVADCVEDADRALMARPAYRAELADWVATGDRNDGLSADAVGMPSALLGIAPWLIRHVDAGALQGRRDAELTRSSSMLVVVTSDEKPMDLVKAGETLELLLLTITRCGLQYSFLNSPVECDETRERLHLMVGGARKPQLLIRIGSTARTGPATRRRPVESVIV